MVIKLSSWQKLLKAFRHPKVNLQHHTAFSSHIFMRLAAHFGWMSLEMIFLQSLQVYSSWRNTGMKSESL